MQHVPRVFPSAHLARFAVLLAVTLLCSCHREGLRSAVVEQSLVPSLSSDELFEIGLYQARRGDLLRAEQYLMAAGESGHDEAAVVYWLLRVCVSAGRYHSALRHALAYLREHPSDWSLRLVVASIHEALGNFAEAQIVLERIVEARPRHALSRYRLGMLYRQQTPTPHRALPHLRAYLELDPDGLHAGEVRELVRAVEEGREP